MGNLFLIAIILFCFLSGLAVALMAIAEYNRYDRDAERRAHERHWYLLKCIEEADKVLLEREDQILEYEQRIDDLRAELSRLEKRRVSEIFKETENV